MTTILVSYDGTDNDRDALALGQLLAGAGASLELAYVSHEGETPGNVPDGVPLHVVGNPSTADGLRDLAVSRQAEMIVFGSEYRTSPGHVDPQATALRLLNGGTVALALAPAGYADAAHQVGAIRPVSEDGDPCTVETAESLAQRLGAAVVEQAGGTVGLIVLGSKPGTVNGRVTISAAAEYLIELADCPVLVLPRGVSVRF